MHHVLGLKALHLFFGDCVQITEGLIFIPWPCRGHNYCWNKVGTFLTLSELSFGGKGETCATGEIQWQHSLRTRCSGLWESFPTSLAQSPGSKMLARLCVVVMFTLERTQLQGMERMWTEETQEKKDEWTEQILPSGEHEHCSAISLSHLVFQRVGLEVLMS